MKKIALIPARYNSSRFPGKMLANLNGKTIISSVYQNVVNTKIFDKVVVVTDDKRIFEEIKSIDGNVEMSLKNHKSGTDRIAEIADKIDADIFVNIQGDEPFIDREPLQKLIDSFDDRKVEIASLMHKISDDIENPNNVKVIVDKNYDAIYFSRAKIPFDRDSRSKYEYYKHIGIYGFRKNALMKFVNLPKSNLEEVEKLEQLRLIENNIKIRMIKTAYKGIGIDTKQDLLEAQKILKKEKIVIRRKIGK
ncbi:MAG: 3-deoxy-manno-octulosonate cytidylyltransferase [Candidatus Cloacimonadota bacterium]|nr:3-deoxy-manno-octulosonate cytidylyltransferase [Candidatus Cloacimonadota bacterium]